MQPRRPHFFPVKGEPFRMQPGLFRLGTDFGNGDADRLVFPRDADLAHYLSEKARVLALHPERAALAPLNALESRAVELATTRLRERLLQEGHPAAEGKDLNAMAGGLAEDVVILHAGSGDDRALFVNVCFPSGWKPEGIVGQSFLGIHARIPGFGAVARSAASLVEAMVTRGPYVRFVWTITADGALDHHPEHGQRAAWSSARQAFLRVERQTTLPVSDARASIFVIRTYLYDFRELSELERRTLARALELMPPDVQAYKGLIDAIPRALALLS